jgi:hypothetical protein
MLPRERNVQKLIAVALTVFLGTVASAWADSYPSRPITIVVPFPAGGPTDTLGRILAERMTVALGQSVIVENPTGAAGTIGTGRVARSAPDGYTTILGHWQAHVTNGATYTLSFRPRSERGELVPRRGVIGSKVPRRPYGEEASIVLEQLPRVDLKTLRNAGNVIDGHIPFGPLNCAQISSVDPTFMRQSFLAKTAHGSEPAHVLGQDVPQRSLVRPFHGRDFCELTVLRRPLLSYTRL